MFADKHFRLLVQGVFDYAIYFLDTDGVILTWNAGAERTKGYSAEEIIGRNYEIFYSPADSANRLPLRNLETALHNGHCEDEGWRFRKDGSAFWASIVIHPIYDENGLFIGFAKLTRDLTSQHAAEHRLLQRAMRDSLTGLFNRAAFLDKVEQAMTQIVYGSAIAIHYVDLDRFKLVNDTFGHLAGDDLLRDVACRLKLAAGPNGIAARLGGDEFAILQLDSPTPEATEALARHLVERLGDPFNVGNATITIGASVGVARAPVHGGDASTLMRNADLALYNAKENGRSRYCFYDPLLGDKALCRHVIELKLRHALRAREFTLHYQPVVSAETRETVGFEALLRWWDQTDRAISPADFIPVAEELGLMPELGEWVLQTACAEAATWAKPWTISVNVSATQLCNIGFVEIVRDALKTSGLPAARLELEITETAILADQDLARSILYSLRELGVLIALDDFGTGFSSLSMVASLPLTRVKIDRSFVSGIDRTRRSTSVIRAVALLCEGYGFAVTAEGVETAEQATILCQHGCSELQGYLFGAPRPATHWQAPHRTVQSASMH